MVKVHQEGVFTVFVYSPPREHRPPHVHVECLRGGEVVIRLGSNQAPPSLWQNHHMAMADARVALGIVERLQISLLAEWRKLHGEVNPH
jgi:hypothetical protein